MPLYITVTTFLENKPTRDKQKPKQETKIYDIWQHGGKGNDQLGRQAGWQAGMCNYSNMHTLAVTTCNGIQTDKTRHSGQNKIKRKQFPIDISTIKSLDYVFEMYCLVCLEKKGHGAFTFEIGFFFHGSKSNGWTVSTVLMQINCLDLWYAKCF